MIKSVIEKIPGDRIITRLTQSGIGIPKSRSGMPVSAGKCNPLWRKSIASFSRHCAVALTGRHEKQMVVFCQAGAWPFFFHFPGM
jgi:hypothetical protein